VPTGKPSFDPSELPSFMPTEVPSSVPSEVPSSVPSGAPTSVPTEPRVFAPVKESGSPSAFPSYQELSDLSTEQPSQAPTAETAENDTLLLGVKASRSDMIYYLIFLVLLVAMLFLCVIACHCKQKQTIVIQKEWISDSVIRDHTAINVTNFSEDDILGTYLAATNPLYDSPKHISPNAGPLKMPTPPPSPIEGETKRTPESPTSPNADFLEGTWSSNVVSDDNGALWYCPDSPSAKRVPEALVAQTSFEDLYGVPEPTLGEVVHAMEESIYRHVSAEGIQDTTTN